MKTTFLTLLGVHAAAVPFLFRFETAFSLLFAAGFIAFAAWDCTRRPRPLRKPAPVLGFAAVLESERLPYAA